MTSVLSEVAGAVRLIGAGEHKIDRSLIQLEATDDPLTASVEIVYTFFENPAPVTPWFYLDESNEIRSPQSPIFGFYALRNLLRSVSIGLRFFHAGDVLLARSFYVAAVAMFYSCVYQLAHGLLAFAGRVLIQPVLGPPKVIAKGNQVWGEYLGLPGDKGVIVGILTGKGDWVFERRPRNHAAHWREVQAVINSWSADPPQFFLDFFTYLCSYRGELMVEEAQLVEEGLRHLREGRHESLYQGRAFDPTALDLAEEEGFGGGGAGRFKAEAYRDFAYGLLGFTADELIEARDIVAPDLQLVQTALIASAFNPVFEMQFASLPDDDSLNEKLGQALGWVFKDWRPRR